MLTRLKDGVISLTNIFFSQVEAVAQNHWARSLERPFNHITALETQKVASATQTFRPAQRSYIELPYSRIAPPYL